MSGITINGRFLTRRLTGVDRFALEIMRAWCPASKVRPGLKISVPSNCEPARMHGLSIPLNPAGNFNGHAWEQLQLPRNCASDVLVSFCNTGPIAVKRQLVVLHDVAAVAIPSNYGIAFRIWYRWLFWALMKRVAVVATVSKFSAGELLNRIGGRAAGVEVIYESGEHVLDAEADRDILQRLYLENRPYILAVGSRTANKNFAGIVQAAAMLTDLDIKVVVAGGHNSRVFAGTEVGGKNVILAGYVTDGELRCLYENAQCFVFPSFYEGFGLPPLEAMHCGCPVIVSRRAALPEVCGDAAVYCDPQDPGDIAKRIRAVLSSRQLRGELVEAGFARARMFSWAHSARTLEEIIQRNFAGVA